MVIVSSTKAGSKPHLTTRLVLELMTIDSTAQQRSRSRSSYAAGASSPSTRTSENTAGSNVQHLQQLLMQAGCPGCSEISTSEDLLWSSRTALATSNEDSVESDDTCSWGEDDECEEFDFEEDRGRLFANVGAQGSSSSDESFFASGGSPSERKNTHESKDSKR